MPMPVSLTVIAASCAFEEAATEHKGLVDDLRDVEKLIAAEMAGRTDQFRTIEGAEAPLTPTSPNRPFLLVMVLAAGCSESSTPDSNTQVFQTVNEVAAARRAQQQKNWKQFVTLAVTETLPKD